MATSAPASSTPPRLVVATAATTEASIQQLLAARTKIARRAVALDQDLQQRAARDRRDFTEQAAQQVVAAPADFDARVVDGLAARLATLDDNDAKNAATIEALRRTAELIEARLDDIKNSPDRDLLARGLERERQRLDQERAERQDDADLLARMIERIQTDLDEIDAAAAFAPAPPAASTGSGAAPAGGPSAQEAPASSSTSASTAAKDGGARKSRS